MEHNLLQTLLNSEDKYIDLKDIYLYIFGIDMRSSKTMGLSRYNQTLASSIEFDFKIKREL